MSAQFLQHLAALEKRMQATEAEVKDLKAKVQFLEETKDQKPATWQTLKLPEKPKAA